MRFCRAVCNFLLFIPPHERGSTKIKVITITDGKQGGDKKVREHQKSDGGGGQKTKAQRQPRDREDSDVV